MENVTWIDWLAVVSGVLVMLLLWVMFLEFLWPGGPDSNRGPGE